MTAFSYTPHTGDGVTKAFPFTFVGPEGEDGLIGYWNETQISVTVDGEPVLFEVTGPSQVTLDVAPPLASQVLVKRSIDPSAPYSAFKRGNEFVKRVLNRSFQYILYLVQSAYDGFKPDGYYEKQDLSLGNNRITDLADPVEFQDAATKSYFDSRLGEAVALDSEFWATVATLAVGPITGYVESMKALADVPELHNKTVIIKSFYEDDNKSSRTLWYDSTVSRSLANGFEIVDATAMDSFDGTSATLQQFYDAQGTNTGSGCWLARSSELSIESLTELFDFVPIGPGYAVQVKGIYPGSNTGGGFYFYDESADKADANGITIIDTSADKFDGTTAGLAAYFADQGTGTGSGCWIRSLATHGELSIEDAGAVVGGSVDNLVAINKMIDMINKEIVVNWRITGTRCVISGNPDPLTASDWSIVGNAKGNGNLVMSSTAGTAGTFFQVGDASNRCENWLIQGFEVRCENQTSLDGTQNPFFVANSAAGEIDLIRLTSTAGFITIGDTSFGTFCNQTKSTRITANVYLPAGGQTLRLIASAGHFFQFCSFAGNGTATSATRGMLMKPTATDTFDTGKFSACEWNYPGHDVEIVIEADATEHQIGNQLFTSCVIDQGIFANFYINISSGAEVISHIDFNLVGCISNGRTEGTPIIINNEGGRYINFNWTGGELTSTGGAIVGGIKPAYCAKMLGGNKSYLTITGAVLLSRVTTTNPEAAILVGDGCEGLTVTGCFTPVRENSGTGIQFLPYNHLVEFEGSAAGCIITGNNCSELAKWPVKFDDIGTGLDNVRVTNNVGQRRGELPFYLTMPIQAGVPTDPQSVNAQVVPLPDALPTVIRAKVLASRAVGLDRAYYEFVGLFYRDGGGATLEGSVNYLTNVESTDWTAQFVTSGNDVLLQFISVNGVETHWSWQLEIFEGI